MLEDAVSLGIRTTTENSGSQTSRNLCMKVFHRRSFSLCLSTGTLRRAQSLSTKDSKPTANKRAQAMLDSAADTPHWERFGFDKGQSETNRDRRPGLCLDPQARPFAVETHRLPDSRNPQQFVGLHTQPPAGVCHAIGDGPLDVRGEIGPVHGLEVEVGERQPGETPR